MTSIMLVNNNQLTDIYFPAVNTVGQNITKRKKLAKWLLFEYHL